eukprot:14748917-Ditylum_brightwellii.AAC.1
MTFGLVAKYSLHNLLISQPCNCDIETSAVEMTVPFLVASNIGVEHHVCWLVIVLELAYQHVTKVRNLCNLLKIDLHVKV